MEFVTAHPRPCIAIAALALSAGIHIAGQSRNLTAAHALAGIWLVIAFIGGPHVLLMWAASIVGAAGVVLGIFDPIEPRRARQPAEPAEVPATATAPVPKATPDRAVAVLERQPPTYRGELHSPPAPRLTAPIRSPGQWME